MAMIESEDTSFDLAEKLLEAMRPILADYSEMDQCFAIRTVIMSMPVLKKDFDGFAEFVNEWKEQEEMEEEAQFNHLRKRLRDEFGVQSPENIETRLLKSRVEEFERRAR